MCRERDVGHIEGFPTCRERDVGYIEGFPTCRERDVGYIEGIPIRREHDVGHIEGLSHVQGARCGTHGRTDTRQGTQQPRCGTSACLADTFRLGALFRACSRF